MIDQSFNLNIQPIMTQEEIKSQISLVAVSFGRWLLKHAEPIWSEGSLAWKYGEEVLDTHELYALFLEEF